MALAEWLDWLQQIPQPAAWAALGAAALIEYVFPPFPGDTVVLAGAVLVGAFGWSVSPVLGALTLGAVLGSAIDFQAGKWFLESGRYEQMKPARKAALDSVVDGFRKWGPIYLALNRFFPGVRALFFVAAGIAGLRWPAVLLWSTVSALAWNGILVAAGVAAGANLELLEDGMRRYSAVVGVLVVGMLGFAGWRAWRAWKQAEAG